MPETTRQKEMGVETDDWQMEKAIRTVPTADRMRRLIRGCIIAGVAGAGVSEVWKYKKAAPAKNIQNLAGADTALFAEEMTAPIFTLAIAIFGLWIGKKMTKDARDQLRKLYAESPMDVEAAAAKLGLSSYVQTILKGEDQRAEGKRFGSF